MKSEREIDASWKDFDKQDRVTLVSVCCYRNEAVGNDESFCYFVITAHTTQPAMNDLFDFDDNVSDQRSRPLAERIRPTMLDNVVGQDHLLGPHGPLSGFVKKGAIPSMILWGPPGTGKTTLASLLASAIGADFERISAVDSGVKELRQIITKAEFRLRSGTKTVLFIDEVHRFNKSQQDALLHAVERGIVSVIGATTENPSFEVNSALLSRCHVYRLNLLSADAIRTIVERALSSDTWLAAQNIAITEWETLYTLAAGDARAALNALEAAALIAQPDQNGVRHVTPEILQTAVQKRIARYDKAGDAHYDTISAFIKTIRGSDPDAALVYLAAMLEAGEDPLFIARRLIIVASEDVGNADPQALNVAVSTFLALERIGLPEGRLTLSQCTIYLACAPKSNASCQAFEKAASILKEGHGITIPLHLRNAPTRLMKEYGFGKEYRYPHNYPSHFVNDNYFPDEINSQKIYDPDGEGEEAEIIRRLRMRWPDRWNNDF